MIGRKIGQYEVKQLLGRGGMGEVWLAFHPFLERKVAIKVLSSRFGEAEGAKERFLREARAAGKLQHENIATVFDAGEEDGSVYIVFEYVNGMTAADIVKRSPLSLGKASRVARQTATALQYAHVRGIVHRDVSGRNVMIDRSPDRGDKAVLVDFGLALLKEEAGLTRTGDPAMGTPAYMAPEVIKDSKADERSDIYGLGVVLYEMLTGCLPFDGERYESITYKIVHEEAVPPRELRPGIPEGLERVVVRAMAKDPGERYQSAEEMAEDLREFESIPEVKTVLIPSPADDDSGERRGSWFARAVERPRRHPVQGGIVVLSVAVVAVIAWKLIHPPPPVPPDVQFASLAVLQVTTDGEVAPEAYSIGESLARKLSGIKGLKVTPYSISGNIDPRETVGSVIARELHVEGLVTLELGREGQRLKLTAGLQDPMKSLQLWSKTFDELVTDLLPMQNEVALGLARYLKPDLSEEERKAITDQPTVNSEAYSEFAEGADIWRRARDRPAAEQALAKFREAAKLDPRFADAHVGIGAVQRSWYFTGHTGEEGLRLAEESFRKALEIEPRHVRALRGLIGVHWHRGENEACLEIGETVRQSGRVDAEALLVRAEAYFLGGLPDLAVPLYRQVLELHPTYRAAAWYLVVSEVWAGQFESAIESANMYLKNFDDDPEILVWTGVAHDLLGHTEDAGLYYDTAIERFGLISNHYAYYFASHFYERLGERQKAIDLCSAGARDLQQLLEFNPDNKRMQASLFALHCILGDRDAADELARRLDFENTDNGYLLWYGAVGNVRRGDRERAVSYLRRGVELGSQGGYWFTTGPALGFDALESLDSYEDLIREAEKREASLRSRYGPRGTGSESPVAG